MAIALARPCRASLLQPYLPLPYVEPHHVNGADQVVVADGHEKALQGFLLVAMTENRVRYGRMDATTHGIRVQTCVGCGYPAERDGPCR